MSSAPARRLKETSHRTERIEDADAVIGNLADRGVELLNGPIDRAWGLRTAAFADPDGHVWEVAQQFAES